MENQLQDSGHNEIDFTLTQLKQFVDELDAASNPFAVKRMIHDFIGAQEEDQQPAILDELENLLGRYSNKNDFTIMFVHEQGQKKLEQAFLTIEQMRQGIQQQASFSGRFKISDKLSKVDLVRICNVMYELGYFHDENGMIPSKKVFMEGMGKIFSMDLSKYDENLSQGYKTEMEGYTKVFRLMVQKAQELWAERLNKKLSDNQ